ncbi:TetR/AcrR family transcriptional regulator [Embleya sp. MST-111070]|uniref:TetR/AcrR family transcriptional regulator n=1 Tax=Embleya sp. MST-111070 TaxID=3398231 RepID=UPI003F73EED0
MATSDVRPITTGRGRPRDHRIDEAVLAATMRLLEEGGYADFTLEGVAVRAGTTKPAIRRRWPSRRHLVIDALVTAMGEAPTPDTGCTHCDLIVGIATLTTAFAGPGTRRVWPALVADLAADPALAQTFFARLFDPRRAATAAALRRGITRGDIRPDTDLDLLLDLLASTTYYRALFGHLPITDTLAEDIVMIVMSGVATDTWRAEHERPHTHG